MNKENWRQAIIAILIGAMVAFLSTLFEQLAFFLKAHSTEIISGISSTAAYLARTIRINYS